MCCQTYSCCFLSNIRLQWNHCLTYLMFTSDVGVLSEWTTWTCEDSCGYTTEYRNRTCLNDPDYYYYHSCPPSCDGPFSEENECDAGCCDSESISFNFTLQWAFCLRHTYTHTCVCIHSYEIHNRYHIIFVNLLLGQPPLFSLLLFNLQGKSINLQGNSINPHFLLVSTSYPLTYRLLFSSINHQTQEYGAHGILMDAMLTAVMDTYVAIGLVDRILILKQLTLTAHPSAMDPMKIIRNATQDAVTVCTFFTLIYIVMSITVAL